MSQELIEIPPDPEFTETTVVATNRPQMEAAQATLVACAESRLMGLCLQRNELEQNLEIAKKNKLKQSVVQNNLYRVQRKLVFYEKLKLAFEAGFVLIPDMGVDVFAIRTRKGGPPSRYTTRTEYYVPSFVFILDEKGDLSPAGEGRYVDPVPTRRESKKAKEGTNSEGKTTYTLEAWNEDWKEEITFPFILAKPQIVDLTTRAMALKIFDDLGVLPNTAKTDPMVVGRIHLREGYNTKTFNFLVAWFVDTRTL